LNNNRNSNTNRRRGRNPNRPQGGGGGGSGSGNQMNRIDSRARGNAPQLLDKYKKLAQDSQHNGDRVQAEYFLQYADHYFRVINDNKLRQDEARAARGDTRTDTRSDRGGRDDQNDGQSSDSQSQRGDDDDNRRPPRSRNRQDEGDFRDDDGDYDDRGEGSRGNSDRGSQDQGSRNDGDRSGNGRSRDNNGRGRGNGSDRDQDDDSSDYSDNAPAPKVRAKIERAPRKPRAPKPASDSRGEIDIAVLPPAIGKSSDDAPAKKPALRPRRKRADDSETLV